VIDLVIAVVIVVVIVIVIVIVLVLVLVLVLDLESRAAPRYVKAGSRCPGSSPRWGPGPDTPGPWHP
jgi:hypothetical protein